MTNATLEPMAASGDPTAAPTRAAPVVEVQNLKAYYQVSQYGVVREVRAVDDISLRIESGEIYGLAGESSSGKTTLIKVIAAATRPPLNVVGGTVRFRFGGETVDLYGGAPPDLQALRWRSFSYIMQGSMNVLNPVRRIRHSFVDFAFRHLGQPMPQFMATVGAHLERLHLRPSVLDAYPHELSGGMRQRVTIALATVCRPEFIIADEPTTALDVVVQKGVLAMIREVQLELGSSLLFVTHDMAVHANLCDRLGIMYAGRLVEEGPTARVFREPRHPYTRHLIASLPRIGDTKPREGLKGVPPSLADPPQGCRFHPRCPLAMAVCSERVPPMMPLAHGRGRVACFAATPEAIGKDAR
jgi:peptide/nickel transport system ATP-binding protein